MSDTNYTKTTAKVADTRDPRDIHRDTLEQEIATLRRQLDDARVDVAGLRAACIEAEHQRDVLMRRIGRDVVAAIVACVPARVADVFTGAQHIDEATQKALDDTVSRAEQAERERDEARAEVARITAHLHPRPEPVDLVALHAQARREAGGIEVPTPDPKREPPCPDFRRGDKVRDVACAREWNIDDAPHYSDRWRVLISQVDGGPYVTDVAWLDLSTRVRTWQPGEVVPHAPLTVMRRATADDTDHGDAWARALPLAEPWTQTGVS